MYKQKRDSFVRNPLRMYLGYMLPTEVISVTHITQNVKYFTGN